MKYDEMREAALKIYSTTFDLAFDNPDSKDKLFSGNPSRWNYNACVATSCGSYSAYASGYHLAAKLLMRIAIFSERNIDELIFPIIFLYRHYLELMLKGLIMQGLNIKGAHPDEDLAEALGKHNLMRLWSKFKPIFEEVSGHNKDFSKIRKGIESYLNQINQVGPESMSFRYEKTKDGSRLNLDGMTHINIVDLCNNIEKLTNILEAISCEFAEVESWANEMRFDAWSY